MAVIESTRPTRRRWIGKRDEVFCSNGITYRLNDNTEITWRFNSAAIYVSTRTDSGWLTTQLTRESFSITNPFDISRACHDFRRIANRYAREVLQCC